jgi:hypothetical protein
MTLLNRDNGLAVMSDLRSTQIFQVLSAMNQLIELRQKKQKTKYALEVKRRCLVQEVAALKQEKNEQGSVLKTLLLSNCYYHALGFTDIVRGVHYKEKLAQSQLAQCDIEQKKIKLSIVNIGIRLDFLEEKMIVLRRSCDGFHQDDYLNMSLLASHFPV